MNYYKFRNPPVFENHDSIIAVLKKFRTKSDLPFSFSPEQLQTILNQAIIHDKSPEIKTPVLNHILLFMLTGMRLNEGLSLKWSDIDMQTGFITIKAQKTGKTRILPILESRNGDIAPTFFKILQAWREKSKSDYVLPHPLSAKPVNITRPMLNFKNMLKLPNLTFQNLRKNFSSYVVSFGIAPSIEAFWVGHSPAVSEKYYSHYEIGSLKGDSIEQSMGIQKILQKILKDCNNL